MAVTPVGNRPQAPANLEATKPANQPAKAEATANEAANAPAAKNVEVRAALQRDTFEPAAVAADDQMVALGGAEQASQAQQPQDVAVEAQGQALPLEEPLTPEQETALEEQAVEVVADVAEAVEVLADETIPVEEKVSKVVDALSSMLNLMLGALNPSTLDVGQGVDQAVADNPLVNPGPPDNALFQDPNPLGILGPGGPGTKPGAFGVVGINQHDPNADGENGGYKFGQTNCAPTAMAQIARGKSLEDPNFSLTWDDNGQSVTKRVADMTNEELVTALGKIGNTDDLGTSPNGVIDMAAQLGLNVDESEVRFDPNWVEGGPSNSFDEGWLRDQLAQGKKVIVNGAFEAEGENGQSEKVGHYATIAGVTDEGKFLVMDPLNGQMKEVDARQLAEFMQGNPHNGGVMMAIG